MKKFFEDDIIPSKPIIQYHEFKCFQCGFGNRFLKPESFVDYKKEFELQRKTTHGLIHAVNDLLAFSERNYKLNPSKDILIEALTKLRNKYS